MALEEKRAWIVALASVVSYAIYVAVVGGRLGDAPPDRVSYVPVLIGSTVVFIAVTIALNIVVAIAGRHEPERRDQRDREIGRFGEYVGQSLVVTGGAVAMVLAMLEADYFWIANTLMLSFILSGLLGSAAKIFAYRRGIHQW